LWAAVGCGIRLRCWGARDQIDPGQRLECTLHTKCTQVQYSLYIYVKIYITTVVPGGKRKKERKNGEADNPKLWTRRSVQAQSHRLAPEACASRRCSKMRQAAIKTSRADFKTWEMSWTGSIPRSTRALEIPTTSYDSCSASAARSPLIPSTCVRVSFSSTGRSHPSTVSPLAPPGPSPTGKEGSSIPPTFS
jgi:hypothetical protein